MTVEVRLEELCFSGGDRVAPPQEGVLLIVGPNNVGKSLALREVVSLLTNPPQPVSPPRVVVEISASKTGGVDEFESWLDKHARRREPRPGNAQVTYTGPGLGVVGWGELQGAWQQAPPLGRAAPLFVNYLAPGERLNLLGSAQLWDAMQEDPQHPIQILYDTPNLEEQLSAVAAEAFGVPLFVNRYAGTQIHLQVGHPPEPVAPPAPRDLMDRLRILPHAVEQGDGLRSFMGILLTLIAGVQRILVIDEPEAFLHPPQAKLLGRKLAEFAPEGRQVIAATHSSEVVIGALDAPDAKVTIVRLTREGDVNRIAVLSHEQLRELWSDPLLRYSNVLDGLFHRAVVVCEGDGDSMFLAAAFDHWLAERGLPASEVLFTHSAGKARLYKVAAALRAVDVPVRVVADIDVLQGEGDLGRILDALGVAPERILELRTMIDADVGGGAPNPRKEFVEDRFNEILGPCPSGQALPDDAVHELRACLRSTRGWSLVKEGGLAVLKGDTLVRCQQVIQEASDVGLLIMNGELESFDKTIAMHGPDWVAEALLRGVHQSAAVQGFITTLAASLGIESGSTDGAP